MKHKAVVVGMPFIWLYHGYYIASYDIIYMYIIILYCTKYNTQYNLRHSAWIRIEDTNVFLLPKLLPAIFKAEHTSEYIRAYVLQLY